MTEQEYFEILEWLPAALECVVRLESEYGRMTEYNNYEIVELLKQIVKEHRVKGNLNEV